MVKVVLANSSYKNHMTSEGNELQLGLAHHGWILAGYKYDNITDVPKIIDTYHPDVILIQDKRDWDRDHPGSFGNHDLHFSHTEVLADHPEIYKIAVFKDAGSSLPYQYDHFKEIKADTLLTYYHEKAIRKLNPELNYPLIRTYHSIDKDIINSLTPTPRKDKTLISGAIGKQVYPQRTDLMLTALNHMTNGALEAYVHPGYGATRPMSPEYLQTLKSYKVSICTCSKYQFALRKIIEATACGCIPLTNLPTWDPLPVIDKYLVRVSMGDNSKDIIKLAELTVDLWTPELEAEMVKDTLAYYDYRNITNILDKNITELVIKHKEEQK